MQTDKAVGAPCGFSQGIHRKRGSVGGKNRFWATSSIKRLEDSSFDVEVFEHGFDDEIRVLCRVFNTHNASDSALNRFNLAGREDPSLDGFGKEISDDALTAVDPLLLTVHHLNVKFFLSRFLCNSGTHVPCTNNCHALNRLHGLAN